MNNQQYANKLGLTSEEKGIISDYWVDGYSPRTAKETQAETLSFIESKIDSIIKRLEQIEQVMQIDYCEPNIKKKEDVFDRWLK